MLPYIWCVCVCTCVHERVVCEYIYILYIVYVNIYIVYTTYTLYVISCEISSGVYMNLSLDLSPDI